MLLPMLSIYQEYVRNHHFSLQVLAECKQREKFASMLRRLEEKPIIQGNQSINQSFNRTFKHQFSLIFFAHTHIGRTLETFLTYPMHQVNLSAIFFSNKIIIDCSFYHKKETTKKKIKIFSLQPYFHFSQYSNHYRYRYAHRFYPKT